MIDIPVIHFKEPYSYGEEILTLTGNGGNIYVLSDFHLGGGVNHNNNYEGTENFMADFSFARLIKHLQHNQTTRHTLVINGDLVDFLRITTLPVTDIDFEYWQEYLAGIGMVKTLEALKSSISDREKKFGLETDDFKSVWKLIIAARGHQPVIDSLASWLRQGHQLVITKGNHDLEWYWKAIRDAFKYELCGSIQAIEKISMQKIAKDFIDPTIFFADQAVMIENYIYIEHGHRFERFTSVDGKPLLDNQKELNLPFGSFFNRYLINRIELAYPYIDNIRPRQQILAILIRERFPLAIKLLFNYLILTVRVIPKNQYRYAFYYLFQFLMIIALPVLATAFIIFKTVDFNTGGTQNFIWKTVLPVIKNLAFLSSSYFIGRLFSWLQLSGPSTLAPFVKDLLHTTTVPSIVTFGHTHNPEKLISGTHQRYFNTGTWMAVFEADAADIRIDRTFTILCITRNKKGIADNAELVRWNDDALRLDTLPLTERR